MILWILKNWKLVVALALAAAALGLAARAGYGMSERKWLARESERLAEEARAREADLQVAQSVSAAYQQIVAELRRINNVNRVETIRETNRIEYRCPLPESGLRLLNDAIDAANKAAAGLSPTVSAAGETPAQ